MKAEANNSSDLLKELEEGTKKQRKLTRSDTTCEKIRIRSVFVS